MTASKTIVTRLSLTPQEHAELTRVSQEAGISISRLVVSRTLKGMSVEAIAQEVQRAREVLQAALAALDGVDDMVPRDGVPQEATIDSDRG